MYEHRNVNETQQNICHVHSNNNEKLTSTADQDEKADVQRASSNAISKLEPVKMVLHGFSGAKLIFISKLQHRRKQIVL